MINKDQSLLTDLYQLTMAYGYFKEGKHKQRAVFDMFYRRHDESPFVVFAGLEQLLEYIQNLSFSDSDIEYLRTLRLFDEDFLSYLKAFRFTGRIYAMDEGTIAFPHEPMIRVEGGLLEGQLIETGLLNIINHQTLISTKASRIVRVATPCAVSDFGLRRAQGSDAALYGARAAYLSGVASSSNVLAGKAFSIPVSGTHAHSWVMSFDSELEAFRAYAREFPDKCILLVDTFDVLKSGVPNAITVFNELKAIGKTPIGIRLDSGDLAYLSKKARAMLDATGHTEVKIYATNDLDEYTIQSLILQGARIDVYGVGTKLITSFNSPALGGVYKLSQLEGVPKMKLSENIQKTTNPSAKTVYRLFDKNSRKAVADLISLADETFDETKPLTIYHPTLTWKKTTLQNIYFVNLLSIYFDNGVVKEVPNMEKARENTRKNINDFWEEHLRITTPQEYKVDISDSLYDLKKELISRYTAR